MNSLSLRAVCKSFGNVNVIHDMDLEVSKGEFIIFVGPSGCGKSTILRMISGLEDTSSGQILIGDKDITYLPAAQREIAMVFQSYALFPHMNVADNISFGLRLAKVLKEDIAKRVAAVADILQLTPLLQRYPRQLSGGQRQRVAIGRAIIRNPKIFLFDEPLSNLDAALRVQMRLEIARLHRRLGATIVYVTHDQTEAMTLADRIVVLNAGRIEQIGTPIKLYEKPQNKFVAGFIGSPAMNFLAARIRPVGKKAQLSLGGFTLNHEISVKKEAKVILGIRPEHLSITQRGKEDFMAEVDVVETLGAETFAYLQTDFSKESITLRLSSKKHLNVGNRIPITITRNAVHLFDERGDLLAGAS